MKPRTSGAIALMSTGNLEGSWFLSNLEIVNRTKATALPMTDNIIEYLNQIALDEKGRTASNFSDRYGTVLTIALMRCFIV